jgi:hypothetical protein
VFGILWEALWTARWNRLCQWKRVDNVCTTAEPYFEPPNEAGIEMAISKLKNWKETGHDQIQAKLIKEGGKELKKSINELTLKYGRKRSSHTSGNML